MTFVSNSLNAGAFTFPPKMSMNSWVNLKAADSNLISFPGDQSNIKPKSIWIKPPVSSIKILPLCLSLICKINETTA